MLMTMNPLLIYVEEFCDLGPDCKMLTTESYSHYLDWCKEGHNRPLSRNRFYDQILMNFPGVRKDKSENRWHFIGIGRKFVI